MRSDDPTLTALLTATHTYALPELAAFYGLPHPTGGSFSPDHFLKVPLPDDERRGGIFGQAAFLASFAQMLSHCVVQQ